jgi:hypothetical protein
VDFALNEITGLMCRSEGGSSVHWQNGLANMYLEAEGNIPLIRRAITYASRKYEPTNPHAFVNTIRKMFADENTQNTEDGAW